MNDVIVGDVGANGETLKNEGNSVDYGVNKDANHGRQHLVDNGVNKDANDRQQDKGIGNGVQRYNSDIKAREDEVDTEKDEGEAQSMEAEKLHLSSGFTLSGTFGFVSLCIISCFLFL